MTIVHTYSVTNSKNAALAFSAILAADKGVPSTIKTIKGGHRVIADDGKAVDFIRA